MKTDNPVPSLEFTKDEIQHIKDKLESCFRGFINNNCYFQGEYALALEKSILSKLQNGVETNKEQPNKQSQFAKDWHESDAII